MTTTAPSAPAGLDAAAITAIAQAIVTAGQMAGRKAYGGGRDPWEVGYRHDAPSGGPISVGYSHGPGGNLSFPGVDPAVFNAMVGPRGILGQLPTKPSVFTNPTYFMLTGVGADDGDEKSGVCDDAPTAGLMESGLLTSVFGRYERATKQIELNRLGQFNDRADPMDLYLVGSPIEESGIFLSGPGNPSAPADVLRNETARKFWELGVSLQRLISKQLWQGNPINNSAGGGYREMTGLDILIRENWMDAETGAPLPAAASDVKDFAYANATDNGTDLVNALTYIFYTRKDLAERSGVMPVRWVWAMRQELFYEITAIWPCAYLTYRCNVMGNPDANAQLIVNGDEQVRMRDAMREGRYLLIDGQRIEVVIDDGIEATYNTQNGNVVSGCMASSIYLLPMSVAGGTSSLFLEYFQYTNPAIDEALGQMVLARVEGAWLTVPKQTNFCIQWQTKIEPRLVLRTPWLAGRLDHVQVCPLQYTRSPFPDDPYYVGGGVESRPGPSYYTPWNVGA